MSGGGFRGRGFRPRGFHPSGMASAIGGPRFPHPNFNQPHRGNRPLGLDVWPEHVPWQQMRGPLPFPNFQPRSGFRGNDTFHGAHGVGRGFRGGRGRGQMNRGGGNGAHQIGPPGLRFPGPFRGRGIDMGNRPRDARSQYFLLNTPPNDPKPPHLGSEEERQQKIIETADKLKQKLSSITMDESINFWEDDMISPATEEPVIVNRGIPELRHDPPELNLTLNDFKDIGRVAKDSGTILDDPTIPLESVQFETEAPVIDICSPEQERDDTQAGDNFEFEIEQLNKDVEIPRDTECFQKASLEPEIVQCEEQSTAPDKVPMQPKEIVTEMEPCLTTDTYKTPGPQENDFPPLNNLPEAEDNVQIRNYESSVLWKENWQPEYTAEETTENTREVMSEMGLGSQPDITSDAQDVPKLDFHPCITSESQPAIRTEFQSQIRPEFRPLIRPAFQPEIRQRFEPQISPGFQPDIIQSFQPVFDCRPEFIPRNPTHSPRFNTRLRGPRGRRQIQRQSDSMNQQDEIGPPPAFDQRGGLSRLEAPPNQNELESPPVFNRHAPPPRLGVPCNQEQLGPGPLFHPKEPPPRLGPLPNHAELQPLPAFDPRGPVSMFPSQEEILQPPPAFDPRPRVFITDSTMLGPPPTFDPRGPPNVLNIGLMDPPPMSDFSTMLPNFAQLPNMHMGNPQPSGFVSALQTDFAPNVHPPSKRRSLLHKFPPPPIAIEPVLPPPALLPLPIPPGALEIQLPPTKECSVSRSQFPPLEQPATANMDDELVEMQEALEFAKQFMNMRNEEDNLQFHMPTFPDLPPVITAYPTKEAAPPIPPEPNLSLNLDKRKVREVKSKRGKQTDHHYAEYGPQLLPDENTEKSDTLANDCSDQTQDGSTLNQEEESLLPEDQSRPKVVFNLNSKMKKISKMDEWQNQNEEVSPKMKKLKVPQTAMPIQSTLQLQAGFDQEPSQNESMPHLEPQPAQSGTHLEKTHVNGHDGRRREKRDRRRRRDRNRRGNDTSREKGRSKDMLSRERSHSRSPGRGNGPFKDRHRKDKSKDRSYSGSLSPGKNYDQQQSKDLQREDLYPVDSNTVQSKILPVNIEDSRDLRLSVPVKDKSLNTSTQGCSWKDKVITRFLKMSKNDIRNMVNNSGLRKFDIAMKRLVRERKTSLSQEMRVSADDKVKGYDMSREEFMTQLSAMLDPSATVDVTNLPTEFIHHLGEVLQMDLEPNSTGTNEPSLGVEQDSDFVDSSNILDLSSIDINDDNLLNNYNTIAKFMDPAITENDYTGENSMQNMKIDLDSSREIQLSHDMDVSDFHLDNPTDFSNLFPDIQEVRERTESDNNLFNETQMATSNVCQQQSTLSNMADVEDIFSAGIAKAKLALKPAQQNLSKPTSLELELFSIGVTKTKSSKTDAPVPEPTVERTMVDLEDIFSAGIVKAKLASLKPMESEGKKFKRKSSSEERYNARFEQTERWNRKNRDDPDMFRNLTKEEWEAKYCRPMDSVTEKEFTAHRKKSSSRETSHGAGSSSPKPLDGPHPLRPKTNYRINRNHSPSIPLRNRSPSPPPLVTSDTIEIDRLQEQCKVMEDGELSKSMSDTDSSSDCSSSSASSNTASPDVTKLLKVIKEREKIAKKKSLNETIRDEVAAEIERAKRKQQKRHKERKARKKEKEKRKKEKRKKHRKRKKNQRTDSSGSESEAKSDSENLLTKDEIKKEVEIKKEPGLVEKPSVRSNTQVATAAGSSEPNITNLLTTAQSQQKDTSLTQNSSIQTTQKTATEKAAIQSGKRKTMNTVSTAQIQPKEKCADSQKEKSAHTPSLQLKTKAQLKEMPYTPASKIQEKSIENKSESLTDNAVNRMEGTSYENPVSSNVKRSESTLAKQIINAETITDYVDKQAKTGDKLKSPVIGEVASKIILETKENSAKKSTDNGTSDVVTMTPDPTSDNKECGKVSEMPTTTTAVSATSEPKLSKSGAKKIDIQVYKTRTLQRKIEKQNKIQHLEAYPDLLTEDLLKLPVPSKIRSEHPKKEKDKKATVGKEQKPQPDKVGDDPTKQLQMKQKSSQITENTDNANKSESPARSEKILGAKDSTRRHTHHHSRESVKSSHEKKQKGTVVKPPVQSSQPSELDKAGNKLDRSKRKPEKDVQDIHDLSIPVKTAVDSNAEAKTNKPEKSNSEKQPDNRPKRKISKDSEKSTSSDDSQKIMKEKLKKTSEETMVKQENTRSVPLRRAGPPVEHNKIQKQAGSLEEGIVELKHMKKKNQTMSNPFEDTKELEPENAPVMKSPLISGKRKVGPLSHKIAMAKKEAELLRQAEESAINTKNVTKKSVQSQQSINVDVTGDVEKQIAVVVEPATSIKPSKLKRETCLTFGLNATKKIETLPQKGLIKLRRRSSENTLQHNTNEEKLLQIPETKEILTVQSSLENSTEEELSKFKNIRSEGSKEMKLMKEKARRKSLDKKQDKVHSQDLNRKDAESSTTEYTVQSEELCLEDTKMAESVDPILNESENPTESKQRGEIDKFLGSQDLLRTDTWPIGTEASVKPMNPSADDNGMKLSIDSTIQPSAIEESEDSVAGITLDDPPIESVDKPGKNRGEDTNMEIEETKEVKESIDHHNESVLNNNFLKAIHTSPCEELKTMEMPTDSEQRTKLRTDEINESIGDESSINNDLNDLIDNISHSEETVSEILEEAERSQIEEYMPDLLVNRKTDIEKTIIEEQSVDEENLINPGPRIQLNESEVIIRHRIATKAQRKELPDHYIAELSSHESSNNSLKGLDQTCDKLSADENSIIENRTSMTKSVLPISEDPVNITVVFSGDTRCEATKLDSNELNENIDHINDEIVEQAEDENVTIEENQDQVTKQDSINDKQQSQETDEIVRHDIEITNHQVTVSNRTVKTQCQLAVQATRAKSETENQETETVSNNICRLVENDFGKKTQIETTENISNVATTKPDDSESVDNENLEAAELESGEGADKIAEIMPCPEAKNPAESVERVFDHSEILRNIGPIGEANEIPSRADTPMTDTLSLDNTIDFDNGEFIVLSEVSSEEDFSDNDKCMPESKIRIGPIKKIGTPPPENDFFTGVNKLSEREISPRSSPFNNLLQGSEEATTVQKNSRPDINSGKEFSPESLSVTPAMSDNPPNTECTETTEADLLTVQPILKIPEKNLVALEKQVTIVSKPLQEEENCIRHLSQGEDRLGNLKNINVTALESIEFTTMGTSSHELEREVLEPMEPIEEVNANPVSNEEYETNVQAGTETAVKEPTGSSNKQETTANPLDREEGATIRINQVETAGNEKSLQQEETFHRLADSTPNREIPELTTEGKKADNNIRGMIEGVFENNFCDESNLQHTDVEKNRAEATLSSSIHPLCNLNGNKEADAEVESISNVMDGEEAASRYPNYSNISKEYNSSNSENTDASEETAAGKEAEGTKKVTINCSGAQEDLSKAYIIQSDGTKTPAHYITGNKTPFVELEKLKDLDALAKRTEPIASSKSVTKARHSSLEHSKDKHLHKIKHKHKMKRSKDKKHKSYDKNLKDTMIDPTMVTVVKQPQTKEGVMARMMDIDLEIHKLMSEKMILYQLLESGTLPTDGSEANKNDTTEPVIETIDRPIRPRTPALMSRLIQYQETLPTTSVQAMARSNTESIHSKLSEYTKMNPPHGTKHKVGMKTGTETLQPKSKKSIPSCTSEDEEVSKFTEAGKTPTFKKKRKMREKDEKSIRWENLVDSESGSSTRETSSDRPVDGVKSILKKNTIDDESVRDRPRSRIGKKIDLADETFGRRRSRAGKKFETEESKERPRSRSGKKIEFGAASGQESKERPRSRVGKKIESASFDPTARPKSRTGKRVETATSETLVERPRSKIKKIDLESSGSKEQKERPLSRIGKKIKQLSDPMGKLTDTKAQERQQIYSDESTQESVIPNPAETKKPSKGLLLLQETFKREMAIMKKQKVEAQKLKRSNLKERPRSVGTLTPAEEEMPLITRSAKMVTPNKRKKPEQCSTTLQNAIAVINAVAENRVEHYIPDTVATDIALLLSNLPDISKKSTASKNIITPRQTATEIPKPAEIVAVHTEASKETTQTQQVEPLGYESDVLTEIDADADDLPEVEDIADTLPGSSDKIEDIIGFRSTENMLHGEADDTLHDVIVYPVLQENIMESDEEIGLPSKHSVIPSNVKVTDMIGNLSNDDEFDKRFGDMEKLHNVEDVIGTSPHIEINRSDETMDHPRLDVVSNPDQGNKIPIDQVMEISREFEEVDIEQNKVSIEEDTNATSRSSELARSSESGNLGSERMRKIIYSDKSTNIEDISNHDDKTRISTPVQVAEGNNVNVSDLLNFSKDLDVLDSIIEKVNNDMEERSKEELQTPHPIVLEETLQSAEDMQADKEVMEAFSNTPKLQLTKAKSDSVNTGESLKAVHHESMEGLCLEQLVQTIEETHKRTEDKLHQSVASYQESSSATTEYSSSKPKPSLTIPQESESADFRTNKRLKRGQTESVTLRRSSRHAEEMAQKKTKRGRNTKVCDPDLVDPLTASDRKRKISWSGSSPSQSLAIAQNEATESRKRDKRKFSQKPQTTGPPVTTRRRSDSSTVDHQDQLPISDTGIISSRVEHDPETSPLEKDIRRRSTKRKAISISQMRSCKVRLVRLDSEYTDLRPDLHPSDLKSFGISIINPVSVKEDTASNSPQNESTDSPLVQRITMSPEVQAAIKINEVSPKGAPDLQIAAAPNPEIQIQKNLANVTETQKLPRPAYGNQRLLVKPLSELMGPRRSIGKPQNDSVQQIIPDIEIVGERKTVHSTRSGKEDILMVKSYSDAESNECEEVEAIRTPYTAHKGPILDIKVFGESFLAASEDGIIYHYSLKSRDVMNTFKGHKSAVTCIYALNVASIGTTQEWLFSGSLDGTLRCYNIQTGSQIRGTAEVGSPVQCMDQSWGMIFLGTKSGHVSRFHIKSDAFKGDKIKFSEESVLALKATTEGPRKVLIVASRSQPITIRDAQSGLFLRTVSGHRSHTVYSLMMEKSLVYCGTSSTSIPVFDFINGVQITQYNAGVGIVCMRMHRSLLFAGCYDGNIYVFDTKEPRLICSIPGPGNMLLSMEIVKNRIIAGSKDKRLQVWQMPQQIKAVLKKRT